MSWLRWPLSGLSRMGFMRTSGAMLHASACMIRCAPHLEPVGRDTAVERHVLALEGSHAQAVLRKHTAQPRRKQALPRVDMVPWIMMGFALPTGIDLLRRASAIRARHSAAARSAAPVRRVRLRPMRLPPERAAERIASRAFSLRVRTATRHQKRDSTENESHVRTKTPCLYSARGCLSPACGLKGSSHPTARRKARARRARGKATLARPPIHRACARRIRRLPGRRYPRLGDRGDGPRLPRPANALEELGVSADQIS